MKTKFAALEDLHLRVTQMGMANQEQETNTGSLTRELHQRLKDLEKASMDDERHMTKYIPLQIASLLYEVLRENFTPRFRPKLNQYFITLLGKLEVFLKSGDQYVPRGAGLNFAYLDYNLPTLS